MILPRDRGHSDRHVVERENRESGSRGERSSYSKDKDTDLRFAWGYSPNSRRSIYCSLLLIDQN